MRGRFLAAVTAIAAVLIVLDQLTKALARDRLVPGEAVDVLGPVRLALTFNDGVAFGMAGGRGGLSLILAALALVALGAFIATAPAGLPTTVAAGLILGGAVGNLIDRIRLGHVTDFILFPHWPAFNLADVAITVGVILLALWLLFGQRRAEPSLPEGPEP